MSNKKQDPYYQAQNILSRRDHSEAEVRQKMRRKGFTEGEINEVITWLYEQKLLNDELFALRYIESILLGKPVGPRWLQAKLKQKGVSNIIIETILADTYVDKREVELARQAADSWLRVHKKNDDQKEKLFRFLLSRGFSYESVKDTLTDN